MGVTKSVVGFNSRQYKRRQTFDGVLEWRTVAGADKPFSFSPRGLSPSAPRISLLRSRHGKGPHHFGQAIMILASVAAAWPPVLTGHPLHRHRGEPPRCYSGPWRLH